MRDCIKSKLDMIHKLYPEERIKKSKARWENIWTGKDEGDRRPFVYFPPLFDSYGALHDKEERLQKSLDEIIIRSQVDDDFIPTIFCGCRQSTIPNMFGAKEIIKDQDATCEKILFDYSDIDRLEEAYMGEGTVAAMWLEMQRYIIEETNGEIPVHVVDMQGPFDAAAQMFGYDNLFTCAYEDEKRYDRLMSLITDGFIKFWKKQEEVCGDLFVGTHLFAWDWVPKGLGASMSIDSLVMVSPDFYEEFYQKYIEKMSEAMNGLVVHSCGCFKQVIPNLMKTKGLKGINASQMTLGEMCEAGLTNDKVAILVVLLNQLDDFVRDLKEKKMRCDMTVLGNWGEVFSDCGMIEPKLWSKEQRDKLKKINDNIQQKLSF